MNLVIQVIGTAAGTAIAAALSAAAVTWIGASAFGICDPKFGCTFGLQFGALLAAAGGLLCGLTAMGLYVGYATFHRQPLELKRGLQLALSVGVLIGVGSSGAALMSYW